MATYKVRFIQKFTSHQDVVVTVSDSFKTGEILREAAEKIDPEKWVIKQTGVSHKLGEAKKKAQEKRR